MRNGDSDLASWLALGFFLGVAAGCLAILWPRSWEGTANPREVIETYIESPEPAVLGNLHRDLSIHMHDSYIQNLPGLEQFASLLQIASGLLTLEVALWIVAIAGGF